MKKILSTLLLLILLVSFMPVQALANTEMTVFETPESVSVERGRRLEIPVTVSGNPGFAAVGFEVRFNRNHLRMTGADVRRDGVDPPRDKLRPNNTEFIGSPQWITLIDVRNLDDWTGEGLLMTLAFEVIAPVGVDATDVSLSFTNHPSGRPVSERTGRILPRVEIANNGRTDVTIISSVQGPDGPRPPGQFSVTIQNGGTGATGAGWYLPHATGRPPVTINAGTAPAGQQFNGWTTTSAGVTFANAANAQTTFPMPSNDVIVTANWAPIGGGGGGDGTNPPPPGPNQFQLRVVGAGPGGTPSGNHAAGATVTLNAGTPPTGQTFVNWTRGPANGGNLTNPTSATAAAITLPTDLNAIADRIVTVTANWSGGGFDGGDGGGGGGGGGSGSGNAHGVLQHFGTWTGSGTREGRINADHTRFVRLTRAGTEVAATHYTVTAGSTVITLNESYIATLSNGTHVFRAEFTDGHADLNLIISTGGFGNVPQTGVADITLQVVAMWVSVFLAAGLCVCLFFYRREMRKRANVRAYYGKQKKNAG